MIKSENKRVNITVTPIEWTQLQQLTTKERLSVSKLVARLIDSAATDN
ncbi:hypothetical protein [Furfurilactobacillus milii]|nr:hypothetical protein [Furfurilactobacillus milii]